MQRRTFVVPMLGVILFGASLAAFVSAKAHEPVLRCAASDLVYTRITEAGVGHAGAQQAISSFLRADYPGLGADRLGAASLTAGTVRFTYTEPGTGAIKVIAVAEQGDNGWRISRFTACNSVLVEVSRTMPRRAAR